MIQRPPANLDSLFLDPHSKTTMQEQVYGRIRDAIADGRLRPEERLPSTRSLAAQLNVSRGTIDAAYSRLAAEAYIVGRGAAGTVVSSDIPRKAESRRAAPGPEPDPPNDYLWPFRGGLPAFDLFPRALWTRLAVKTARRFDADAFCYPDPQGLRALRNAIAAYLLVSRGVDCDPSQIFITSGYQGALSHTISMVLEPGDEAWLEDPGYRFARRALEAAQIRLAPIPVDAAGMDVDYGRLHHAAARLAVVTPGHQSPLGMSLNFQRRRALLDWASESDAWIVEDDYDSEFHYSGRKPPSLKSIDRQDRVFYAGSFSKTLFPGLRLGYLVTPTAWIEKARNATELWGRGHSLSEQTVLAAFMADGSYARHLRRMRLHYAERSAALAKALERQFGDEVTIASMQGGLTLLAQFPGRPPDTELVARARAAGLAPSALSAHAVRHATGTGLLLGFPNIRPDKASDAAERLHRAIREP